MTNIIYTRHAETRMQQRAIRERDIPLVIELGTQVDDETWILLKRDVAREIDIRKREIQKLERLANCKVVMLGEPQGQRISLRLGRQKGLANDDGKKNQKVKLWRDNGSLRP